MISKSGYVYVLCGPFRGFTFELGFFRGFTFEFTFELGFFCGFTFEFTFFSLLGSLFVHFSGGPSCLQLTTLKPRATRRSWPLDAGPLLAARRRAGGQGADRGPSISMD